MQLLDELETVLAADAGGGGGGGDGGGRKSGKVSEFRDRELCLVSQTELLKISVGAQGPRSCWVGALAVSGCYWVSRAQA